MGGEFGQWSEWSHDASLDWHLLRDASHAGVLSWLADLNRVYRDEPALHELDTDPAGFRWVRIDDAERGTLSYLRQSRDGQTVLCVMNLTPVPRHDHVVGVPVGGRWLELLNSDAEAYGGSGLGNLGVVTAGDASWRDFPHHLAITVPPLSCVLLKPDAR
jgi:1,4-alpha-glucan branching enzyme